MNFIHLSANINEIHKKLQFKYFISAEQFYQNIIVVSFNKYVQKQCIIVWKHEVGEEGREKMKKGKKKPAIQLQSIVQNLHA